MKKFKLSLATYILLICSMMILPSTARADIDARDYVAAPPGTDLVILYYYHTAGHQLYQNSQRSSNEFDFKSNLGLFRYVHYFKTGPFTTFVNFFLPFGDKSMAGSGAGGTETGSSGLGDVRFNGGIFLVNNPATKTYLGLAEYVSVPSGDYYHEKAMNMGTNRYAFKTELGFSQGFGPGFVFDLMGSGEFYTQNSDANASGGKLQEAPFYSFNAFLSKDFTKDLYLSLGYLFHTNGKNSLNNVDVDNTDQIEHQVQMGVGYHFSQNFSGLATYTSTVASQNGVKYDTVGIKFCYAF